MDEIPVQDVDDVAVSSTKIRKALLDGDIETATSYLGYNFLLTGTVIKGKNLGRTLGFPTANLLIEEKYKLIPKHGAYIVRSKLKNSMVYGMMNIGFNPTVKGDKETIEIHFFNFDGDLYNQILTVEILYRLRDEQHFNSIDELKTQLTKDKEFSLQYIAEHDA